MDSNVSMKDRSNACDLCQKHLGGAWREAKPSDIIVYKVSGGMTNFLYYCSLPETTHLVDGEPRQVLLRLYGPSHSDPELQLKIFTQLASVNLGPKLFSSFHGGRLEEFLAADPLSWNDMTNDKISKVVMQKIAAVHRLKVPNLDQGPNWLIDKINYYNNCCRSLKNCFDPNDMTLESTKSIAFRLMAHDFSSDVEYLRQLIEVTKAPLVFSHNDLHHNNILLLRDSHKDLYDRVVLIDFEYCSYNYRTFDIANHMNEWCFDLNAPDYPYFTADRARFPSIERQRKCLRQYIDAMNDKTSTNNKLLNQDQSYDEREGMIDALLEEMQPFLMASNLLWTLWGIQSAHESKIDFGYWEMAEFKWELYLSCKQQYEKRRNGGDLTNGSSKM